MSYGYLDLGKRSYLNVTDIIKEFMLTVFRYVDLFKTKTGSSVALKPAYQFPLADLFTSSGSAIAPDFHVTYLYSPLPIFTRNMLFVVLNTVLCFSASTVALITKASPGMLF